MIYVNKPSQQRILIGGEGKALKEVGIASRATIEALLERPIFLELWVKTRSGWRQESSFLEEIEQEYGLEIKFLVSRELHQEKYNIAIDETSQIKKEG